MLLGESGIAAAPAAEWELQTADTGISLALKDNALFITRLCSLAEGHNWAGSGLRIPLMGKISAGGRDFTTSWSFVRTEDDSAHGVLRFVFTNRDPHVVLRSIWRARPGHGPIEHWFEIENQSATPVTVYQQDSLSLTGLEPGEPAQLWWIKRGGSNATTQGGTFTEPLAAGHELVLHSNCEDGASPVPWLAVQVGERRGVFVGWEFSGNGRILAKTNGDAKSLDIRVGNEPDFKTDVGPHEVFWCRRRLSAAIRAILMRAAIVCTDSFWKSCGRGCPKTIPTPRWRTTSTWMQVETRPQKPTC